MIPAAATSSALIYVGILMLQGLKNVDFDDLDQVVPVFLMLHRPCPSPAPSATASASAMITYTVIKVFSGKRQGSVRADLRHLPAVHHQVLRSRLSLMQ